MSCKDTPTVFAQRNSDRRTSLMTTEVSSRAGNLQCSKTRTQSSRRSNFSTMSKGIVGPSSFQSILLAAKWSVSPVRRSSCRATTYRKFSNK
jgi:hypothetical protein